MKERRMSERVEQKVIFGLQVFSVAMIWVFCLGISTWIIHLLRLSRRLHDVPSATLGISIVMIPVFLTGASVLTYVFIGLRRGRGAPAAHREEREGS